MTKEKFTLYKEHPKTCAPDDFWGQVKRTINGKAIPQEQIDMIVNASTNGLDLNSDDVLLDLCCGNGALSTLLFNLCRGGVGIDFSEILISVANKNFARPKQDYHLQDVLDYCKQAPNLERFTKILCYGSFAYLENKHAYDLLRALRLNCPNVSQVFIGNCPDKNKLQDFFYDKDYTQGIENEPDSPIGIWRTEEEFTSMAKECGWKASIHRMPKNYYAAHYRYDVVLTHD